MRCGMAADGALWHGTTISLNESYGVSRACGMIGGVVYQLVADSDGEDGDAQAHDDHRRSPRFG